MLSPLSENWQPIRDDCKQFLSIIPNEVDTASFSVFIAERNEGFVCLSLRASVSAAPGLLWAAAWDLGFPLLPDLSPQDR